MAKTKKKIEEKKETKKETNNESLLSKLEAQLPKEAKKEFKEIKSILEKFQKKALKEYKKEILSLALLPPKPKLDSQGKPILNAQGMPEVDKEKIHLFVLIDDKDLKPEEAIKYYDRITKGLIEIAKKTDEKLWLNIKFLQQLWQDFYDAKYEIARELSLSFPFYDKGYVSAIKLTEVHKQMVLKKFEKYIVSYVLSGSLTQGRATEKSDVDVFIVIDDTDVKRMSRIELREKLRGIILGMGIEAGEITGIRNKLNVQVYILTDFWSNIREANPIIFTFLRDGIPLYDRGTFMPWKLLLKQGKIKPSREAIEMYMSTGTQVLQRTKMKLKEIGIEDFFWALLTPSQAALMLFGLAPPTPKETIELMREILVKKEKLIEEKYVKILEKILKVRKDLEHGDKKDITGKEIDELLKDSEEYLKRIEKLFEDIENKKSKETIIELLEEINFTLKKIALELKKEKNMLEKTIKLLVEKAKLTGKEEKMYKDIKKAKEDYEKGKLTKAELEKSKTEGYILLRKLQEILQEITLRKQDKFKIKIATKEKNIDLFYINEELYLIDKDQNIIEKAIFKDKKIKEKKQSSYEELELSLEKAIPKPIILDEETIKEIEKTIGEKISIIIE